MTLLPTSLIFTLASLLVGAALAQTQRPPGLHACQNFLAFNGTQAPLVDSTTFSQYIQCKYHETHGGGSISEHYCWYDYMSYKLYHYPQTPIPVDSHVSCPTDLPLPGLYRIRSFLDTTKCVTALGESDGSPVVIQTCRQDIWRPEQVWHFNDAQIQPLATDKCLDVTNGVSSPGTKLQLWTCNTPGTGTNPNQAFEHWVSNVVIVPEDHIRWAGGSFMCLDLTDGRTVNGNQLQVWPCGYSNQNQHWRLEPVF